MIVLNNVYSDDQSKKITAMSKIGDFELNAASILHNISSYILDEQGSGLNFEQTCNPFAWDGAEIKQMDTIDQFLRFLKSEHTKTAEYLSNQVFQIRQVKKSYGCCSGNPSEYDLRAIAQKMSDEIGKLVPRYKHHIVTEFQPELLAGGCCSKLYNMGRLYVKFNLLKKTKMV